MAAQEGPREQFPVLPGLTILEKLGMGAVGTVYLARHEALKRLVAVKVLRHELAGNRLYVERLRREARLSARLDHPNIVKGLDLGEVAGVPFFVMEFVDGKSLKTVLRERGRLEEDEVLEYGLQLSRALDHAYRSGVVHRDIKPGNLMIARDGTLKLADLGLARRPDDSSVTRDGVTLGTPHYISPEQAREPSSADVRSDLYSVGATLFHMATGRPAFDGETVSEVLSRVWDVNLTPEIPDEVPLSRNLELVIRRLLAKDPNVRYQTPDDLMRDLERVRRRERPNVSVFDINPKAKKNVKRFALAMVISAAVVAGAIGIIKLTDRGRDTGPSKTAIELGMKLKSIEIEGMDTAPALLDRWGRLDSMLASGAMIDADRVRAIDLKTKVENQLSAVATGLERACEQDLLKALSEHYLSAADDFVNTTFPERFREAFGGDSVALPELLATRTKDFLSKKSAEVARAIESAEARIVEALPEFLTKRESGASALLSEGRYKSALSLTNEVLESFTLADGTAWRFLPPAARERITTKTQSRMGSLRSRILESARDTAKRAADRLRSEHDRLEESLRSGLLTAAAADFEDTAKNILTEIHYSEDEWPQQGIQNPEKLIKEFSSSLHSLERQRERDYADRAFSEHDARLAGRWRERQYLGVRDEWRTRAPRSTVSGVKEKMDRRIVYSELLVSIRERAVRNVELKKGKKIQLSLRSGEAAAGKVAGTLLQNDDYIIKLQEGTRAEVHFSALSTADVLALLEFEDVPNDRIERALFYLAEGEFDKSQAELFEIRSKFPASLDSLKIDLDSALFDADQLRSLTKFGGTERDVRFADAKKRAAGHEGIGDFEAAREWYEKARQESAGFSADDPRVAEIDRLIKEFEVRERLSKKSRDLAQAFPNAKFREMPDGRLEVRYDSAALLATISLDPAGEWSKGKTGIVYLKSAAPEQDLTKNPSARWIAPPLGRGPFKIKIRVWIPFDGVDAPVPVRSFTAFGKTVVFAGGKSRGRPITILRSGALDGIEDDIQNAILAEKQDDAIGLLRGSINEIVIEIDADGRAWSVALDGTKLQNVSSQSSSGTSIELRSNSPIEWRELVIEGVTPPKR
ncbi:MAG: serine/threonine-protein kinase [Planctomycetota bacterium]